MGWFQCLPWHGHPLQHQAPRLMGMRHVAHHRWLSGLRHHLILALQPLQHLRVQKHHFCAVHYLQNWSWNLTTRLLEIFRAGQKKKVCRVVKKSNQTEPLWFVDIAVYIRYKLSLQVWFVSYQPVTWCIQRWIELCGSVTAKKILCVQRSFSWKVWLYLSFQISLLDNTKVFPDPILWHFWMFSLKPSSSWIMLLGICVGRTKVNMWFLEKTFWKSSNLVWHYVLAEIGIQFSKSRVLQMQYMRQLRNLLRSVVQTFVHLRSNLVNSAEECYLRKFFGPIGNAILIFWVIFLTIATEIRSLSTEWINM